MNLGPRIDPRRLIVTAGVALIVLAGLVAFVIHNSAGIPR